MILNGCSYFLLTAGSFLLTVELFYLQLTILAFFAYSGKVHLISALRDCKQSSLAVSKKAPTVSKKASPFYTPPPLEGKVAANTSNPYPAPVVHSISGPIDGRLIFNHYWCRCVGAQHRQKPVLATDFLE